jgi:hypothetical protein
MNEKSEQINIRASQQVAQDLRAEAQHRGLPLGETLEQLLALARAERQPGTWVELDEGADAALRSVAAASGVDPATQLATMVRGRLREQLLGLAGRLEGDSPAADGRSARDSPAADGRSARAATASDGLQRHAPQRSAAPPPTTDPAPAPAADDPAASAAAAEDEESLEAVGVFTVFD